MIAVAVIVSAAVGYHSERSRQAAQTDPRRIGKNTLMELFMSADADNSGELDTAEFKQVLISLKLGLNDQELDEMVKDCDSEFDVACLHHATHNTQRSASHGVDQISTFLTWLAARCFGSSSPLQRTATARSTTASSCR